MREISKTRIVSTIITILIVIAMTYGFISAIMDTEKYYYECIDMQELQAINEKVKELRVECVNFVIAKNIP